MVVDNTNNVASDFIDDPKIIDQVGKYLSRFLQEGRKSNFPILSKISDELAIQIWITACQFITKTLENERAVQVTQLGTFSFSSKRLDIGNNKFIIVQRPVFLLSERLAQTHGITYTRHHVSGDIPVATMNYTAIAIAMGRERDLVEGCIREILQALSRVIASREAVQFNFYNIGYLVVRDFRARVKFTPNFIKRMDGTGELSKLMEAKKQARGKTGGPPRAKTSGGRLVSPFTKDLPHSAPKVRSRSLERALDRSEDYTNVLELPEISESDEVAPPSPAPTKPQKSSLPTVGIFSSADLKPSTPVSRPRSKRAQSAASVASSNDCVGFAEREFERAIQEEQDVTDNLTYVAFQRRRQEEEKMRNEARADAVLQRYQDNKDNVAMRKEKKEDDAARSRAKDVAGFNLNTYLDASSDELLQRRKASSPRAYIFKNRPLTPARFQKQHNYSNALAGQVDAKAYKHSTNRAETDHMERREQKELATEIELMRDSHRAKCKLDQRNYRKALSSQIRVKKEVTQKSDEQEELAEPSIPAVPYFGRNHITQDKAIEQKARDRALFKAQLAMASEKRRNAIKKHLHAQQSESQVLRRTHTELLVDQKRNYEAAVDRRRSLEANWVQHTKEKREREASQIRFMRDQRTLLEKDGELHDKYAILFKEKPTGYTSGRFKSNIWRESRYIPGSRLMV